MHKITFALSIIFIASNFAHADSTPPPLVNPGFEQSYSNTSIATSDARVTGQIAANWGDNSTWAPVTIHYSADSTKPHSGKFSQKIEVISGFAQFVQPLHFNPGSYSAKIWMRAKNPMWVMLAVRRLGPPYPNYASQSV